MGGKGGGAPGQDPYEMLDAMTRLNRVDQFTPTGNVQFTGPDRNIATVTNTPEQQALLEGQQALTGTALEQMLGQFGAPGAGVGEGMFGPAAGEMSALASVIGGLPTGGLDLASLPDMPGIGDFGLERSRVEQASYDRMMKLINPTFERREEREGQSLANRGIPERAELADVIAGRRGRDFGEATTGAAIQSVLEGGREQSRLFQDALAGRGQGLQEQLANIGTMSRTRDQLFREIMGTYGAGQGEGAQQFNRLAALLGMSQIGQPGAGMAGFWQPGQADVGGAFSTAQQGWGMNQQYSMQNQLMDLAGTLGAAALGSMGG